MINTVANVQKVSLEFLRILQSNDWFGRTITGNEVREANDYFDANMAMDEAFTNNGLKALDDEGMSQDATDLWNNAWDHAIKLAGK